MATVPQTSEPDLQSLEERFQLLAERWHRAVAHHSSSSIRYGHPDYQAIIALGPAVVPLLLRDLETHRRHWFAALAALTHATPVAPEDAGNVPAMSAAWLRWGSRRAPLLTTDL